MATVDPAMAAAEAQAIADRLAMGGGGMDGSDYSNKRKLDDHEQPTEGIDGPTRKRLSVTGPDGDGMDGGIANGAGEYKEVIDCPKNLVGKLIGREGATIKDLQSRSKTQIQIDHDSVGDSKKVTLSGTRDSVEMAKAMIKDVLDTEPSAMQSGEAAKSVDCPAGIVGRIIGRGGETIRSLQSASGAHIVVDQNFPDGVPRKVNISGRSDAVERAVKMVTELINGEPGSAQQIIQKYGAGDVRYVDCPKAMVGRVIGKGGETIKTLQKTTGASIQIDQNCDPTKITITGKRSAVDQAAGMVKAIINNEDLNAILGGGGPQGFGGGPRPSGFGGGPGFPPSGFPPAGAPYGAPMGGAPYGGYGNFPMQQTAPPAPYPGYGGYGMYGSTYPLAAAAPQQYPSYGNYGNNPAPAAADPYSANSYAGGYNQAAGGAAARPAPAAASVWQEFHDSEGRPFYYNSQTGASQWEKPADLQS